MFNAAIAQFTGTLSGLRDYVSSLTPVLDARMRELFTGENAVSAYPFLASLAALADDVKFIAPRMAETWREKFGGEPEITIEQEDGKRVAHATIPAGGTEGLDQFFNGLNSGLEHKRLLYTNSLISLVSAAEWFLSQIFHEQLSRFPSAIGEKDKIFSLAELKDFSSIQDAYDYYIEKKVEDILRGSFSDWVAALKSKLNLSLTYLEPVHEKLVEVCQRRNVFVHNAGKVNAIYLNRVDASLTEGMSVGDVIGVSEEYLDRAINLMEGNFVLIAAEAWKKLEPSNEDRSRVLIRLAYDHIVAERYDVAEPLCAFTMREKGLKEHDVLVATINRWQCFKWSNNFDEVRDEVSRADFSAKDAQFQLARAALLDDESSFCGLLKKVAGSGNLPRNEFEAWPLFREMRALESVRRCCAELMLGPWESEQVDAPSIDEVTVVLANANEDGESESHEKAVPHGKDKSEAPTSPT